MKGVLGMLSLIALGYGSMYVVAIIYAWVWGL